MKRKDTNFEVDLIAYISLFSVCICFLLLAVAWVQVGGMKVKQAVGGAPMDQAEAPKPALWALIQKDNTIALQLEDAPTAVANAFKRQELKSIEGKVDLESLRAQIINIKGALPDITMALIQPQSETMYEELIGIMDTFKAEGLTDLGVAPL